MKKILALLLFLFASRAPAQAVAQFVTGAGGCTSASSCFIQFSTAHVTPGNAIAVLMGAGSNTMGITFTVIDDNGDTMVLGAGPTFELNVGTYALYAACNVTTGTDVFTKVTVTSSINVQPVLAIAEIKNVKNTGGSSGCLNIGGTGGSNTASNTGPANTDYAPVTFTNSAASSNLTIGSCSNDGAGQARPGTGFALVDPGASVTFALIKKLTSGSTMYTAACQTTVSTLSGIDLIETFIGASSVMHHRVTQY